MTDLPQAAIAAAADVIARKIFEAVPADEEDRMFAIAVLEAAAPHIAAARWNGVREALDDTETAVLALAAMPSERRTDMQVAELMEAADRLARCVRM